METAGGNRFLLLPRTKYFNENNGETEYKIFKNNENPEEIVNLDMKEKGEEKVKFDIFVSKILKFFYRLNIDGSSLITVSGGILNSVEENKLPSLVYGSTVIITGTIQAVNKILRSVFYYASAATYGTAVLTVNVTDTPLACTFPLLYDPITASLRSEKPRSFFLTPPSSLPLLPVLTALNRNTTTASLCNTDTLISHTVSKSVNIYITAVNQPPEVVLTSSTFPSVIGTSVSVPLVSVVDIDHLNGPVTYDSFGNVQLPPVSVIISATFGRVSFSRVDGISVRQGTAKLDKLTSLRGPIDSMNTMISSLTYICRVSDGCTLGQTDSINIIVSDEGFVGLGGTLSANATITVKF